MLEWLLTIAAVLTAVACVSMAGRRAVLPVAMQTLALVVCVSALVFWIIGGGMVAALAPIG